MRRDVAGAARVGVVPPGAADVLGLLQDDEVVPAGLLELDRHAEPGEPGADDDDAGANRRRRRVGLNGRLGSAHRRCSSSSLRSASVGNGSSALALPSSSVRDISVPRGINAASSRRSRGAPRREWACPVDPEAQQPGGADDDTHHDGCQMRDEPSRGIRRGLSESGPNHHSVAEAADPNAAWAATRTPRGPIPCPEAHCRTCRPSPSDLPAFVEGPQRRLEVTPRGLDETRNRSGAYRRG